MLITHSTTLIIVKQCCIHLCTYVNLSGSNRKFIFENNRISFELTSSCCAEVNIENYGTKILNYC